MSNKIILLVEDNPDDATLTLRAFKKNEITNQVTIANDGIEALDYLNGTGKFSGRDVSIMPAIILLDLKLPRMDGLEVLQQIRANEKTKLIPVIILTTSKEEQDIIDCYTYGANSYIRKPIDFDYFIQAIQQLASYWLVLNELPTS